MKIILGTLDFRAKTAKDIMVPWDQVFKLPLECVRVFVLLPVPLSCLCVAHARLRDSVPALTSTPWPLFFAPDFLAFLCAFECSQCGWHLWASYVKLTLCLTVWCSHAAESDHAVAGYLLVKRLIVVDPDDARDVSSLVMRRPVVFPPDGDMFELLRVFQVCHAHPLT